VHRSGFIGSHLTDRLLAEGNVVILLDNFFTGNKENYQHHLGNPHFHVLNYDVIDPIYLDVDQIYHLACPASPYAPLVVLHGDRDRETERSVITMPVGRPH
jgi:nucleoside-diphosphate-sugar epimerase